MTPFSGGGIDAEHKMTVMLYWAYPVSLPIPLTAKKLMITLTSECNITRPGVAAIGARWSDYNDAGSDTYGDWIDYPAAEAGKTYEFDISARIKERVTFQPTATVADDQGIPIYWARLQVWFE